MIEGIYGPPGGASQRGAQYSSPWWARGAQAPDWNPPPDVEIQDPHADPSVGDGPPAVGPSAENVIGGGDFPVSADFSGGYDAGAIPDNIIIGDE
jgi:hypothetical protein